MSSSVSGWEWLIASWTSANCMKMVWNLCRICAAVLIKRLHAAIGMSSVGNSSIARWGWLVRACMTSTWWNVRKLCKYWFISISSIFTKVYQWVCFKETTCVTYLATFLDMVSHKGFSMVRLSANFVCIEHLIKAACHRSCSKRKFYVISLILLLVHK